MFCIKCGSPVNEGEKFCSVCGEKIEAAPAQQTQPTDQRPLDQQPYGQQPYENTYGSVQKKPGKGLWIALGAVAVLAIAAVLIFVVFGNNQPAVSRGALPFEGNTPQTQFANNTVKVISDAFAGFGGEGGDAKDIAKKPFDATMDMTVDAMGQTINLSLDMAYDNQTLGLNLNAMGSSIKMALLEDVLYMDMLGQVTGLDFESSENLSKPMTLEDRLLALTQKLSAQQLSQEDYIEIAEMFLNSIDEKCFENSGSKSILTLDKGDVAAALRKFAGKLDQNKELKEKLENYIKQTSGKSEDIIQQINEAADSLEEEGAADFSIVWEIAMENGKPVSFDINVNDGKEEYVVTFGYKRDGKTTDISFELSSVSTGLVTGTFSYKKTGSKTEYEGDIIFQGQSLTIKGDSETKGDKTSGTVTVNIPETGEITLDYEGTLKIGMPAEKVKDDSRFEIDTSSATVTTMPSLESSGLSGLN